MDAYHVSSDRVIAELLQMGFEFPAVMEAIENAGASLDNALDYILNASNKSTAGHQSLTNGQSSISYNCLAGEAHGLGKKTVPSYSRGQMRQSSITKHIKPSGRVKRARCDYPSISSPSGIMTPKSRCVKDAEASVHMNRRLEPVSESCSYQFPARLSHGRVLYMEENASSLLSSESHTTKYGWEEKVNVLLQKYFGFSSLKGFQKEALEAWLEHKDCLVLAATGSGKSLCFQIPALLTGKVVIVISPLISLMHDQCLKLAKHGVPACFLGSGQPDSSVEQKSMNGMYDIIYICPETVLRLIKPLQRLAERRGIALFAIDEVHCISKWGHDFRPDYRRLSVLRENFSTYSIKSLEYDIPIMALTATATIHVREDVLKSLHMSKNTKIVQTSFFRPNLRFAVKHSKTSCKSSYDEDFRDLVVAYTSKRTKPMRVLDKSMHCLESETSSSDSMSDEDDCYNSDSETSDSDQSSGNSDSETSDSDQPSGNSDSETSDSDQSSGNSDEGIVTNKKPKYISRKRKLSVEYLEDELDIQDCVDDFDVTSGEFDGHSFVVNQDSDGTRVTTNLSRSDEKLMDPEEPLGEGPTIIYVPTRKETLRIADYLCHLGVKAAAYHAKLPKTHLRRVHQGFHKNTVEVVVATIAFGMGIDKSNVRRIIHYGWPQSLEAYYQEAGRAGRDGKLADCILYANLSRIPTLLPSQRSEEQTKHAYEMLSDCFRYGMATSSCRAKILVKYFGEDFRHEKCHLCDVCVNGPPEVQNMRAEVDVFLQVLCSLHHGKRVRQAPRCHSYDDEIPDEVARRLMEKPSLQMIISNVREQNREFAATDRLWWQGLARILRDKGYLREGDGRTRVSMKFPELTEMGLWFLSSELENGFTVYPEADMLLAAKEPKPYSTFAEWGRGWADPEIRRQRLKGRCSQRKKQRRKQPRKKRQDLGTVRGRLTAKLSKRKR